MLSQIAEAITEGYAIIILNPNEPGIQNETPEEHLTYVFKHFISKSPAKFKFFWVQSIIF
jgi:predicted aldo/keto reductase-like oxidoreductase